MWDYKLRKTIIIKKIIKLKSTQLKTRCFFIAKKGGTVKHLLTIIQAGLILGKIFGWTNYKWIIILLPLIIYFGLLVISFIVIGIISYIEHLKLNKLLKELKVKK